MNVSNEKLLNAAKCQGSLGYSKVDLAPHPSEVDQMSTRNFLELSGKE